MKSITSGKLTLVVLEDRPETIMTRRFEAPRELVFLAHSSCEHISQWWGPRGQPLVRCRMDFVVGGTWRYVLSNAEGSEEYPFKGEFREIVAPERLTWTFVFDVEPFNQHAGVETMIFTEEEGRTTITTTSVYPSMEIRDSVISTGMVEGSAETYDRLEEYAASLLTEGSP
ncbi:MAG: SRPBCC family protein [Actinomycetota bacterium]